MEVTAHTLLDILEHIWGYVVGFFVTLSAAIRLWWNDRKETKGRIHSLEVLAERHVTDDELQSCKEEVATVSASHDEIILEEIKAIREEMREESKDNANAHNRIISETSRRHNELMSEIIRLHDKHRDA